MDVVLIEPETSGNIGATARVMANFGFDNLVLVDPKVKYYNKEARERAMRSKPLLKNALILDNWGELENRYDVLVGTTGKRASKYNLRRVSVSEEELSNRVKSQEGDIALVFGRERIGLTNEEIDECDFLVSIKTYEEYPVMNLSHAVAVVLYEIYKKRKEEPLYEPAGREVKEALLEWVKKVMDLVEVDRKEPLVSTFKRVISRSMIKEREAFALAGMFRNIYNKIKKE